MKPERSVILYSSSLNEMYNNVCVTDFGKLQMTFRQRKAENKGHSDKRDDFRWLKMGRSID